MKVIVFSFITVPVEVAAEVPGTAGEGVGVAVGVETGVAVTAGVGEGVGVAIETGVAVGVETGAAVTAGVGEGVFSSSLPQAVNIGTIKTKARARAMNLYHKLLLEHMVKPPTAMIFPNKKRPARLRRPSPLICLMLSTLTLPKL
jgi:hypothetical protein